MVIDVCHVETCDDVWSVPVVTRYTIDETGWVDAVIAAMELVYAHGREPVACV